MDYDLLESIHPRLLNIQDRDGCFWNTTGIELVRNPTKMHTLALVYEGNGTIEVNGEIQPLLQGMLFYFPVGSNLRLTPGRGQQLSFYSVMFHYRLFHWEVSKTDAVVVESAQPLPIPNTLRFNETPQLLDSYRRMVEMWRRREVGFRWKCKLEFQQLLEFILRMNETPSPTRQGSGAIVTQAMEMIEKSLHEPFDRSTLAGHFAITPSHFSVIFKQHTGYTPVEYVTRLRMDRAQQLLRTTRMKIKDIAEMVGYDDSFYFSRLFSKETGMSPSAYRNS